MANLTNMQIKGSTIDISDIKDTPENLLFEQGLLTEVLRSIYTEFGNKVGNSTFKVSLETFLVRQSENIVSMIDHVVPENLADGRLRLNKRLETLNIIIHNIIETLMYIRVKDINIIALSFSHLGKHLESIYPGMTANEVNTLVAENIADLFVTPEQASEVKDNTVKKKSETTHLDWGAINLLPLEGRIRFIVFVSVLIMLFTTVASSKLVFKSDKGNDGFKRDLKRLSKQVMDHTNDHRFDLQQMLENFDLNYIADENEATKYQLIMDKLYQIFARYRNGEDLDSRLLEEFDELERLGFNFTVDHIRILQNLDNNQVRDLVIANLDYLSKSASDVSLRGSSGEILVSLQQNPELADAIGYYMKRAFENNPANPDNHRDFFTNKSNFFDLSGYILLGDTAPMLEGLSNLSPAGLTPGYPSLEGVSVVINRAIDFQSSHPEVSSVEALEIQTLSENVYLADQKKHNTGEQDIDQIAVKVYNAGQKISEDYGLDLAESLRLLNSYYEEPASNYLRKIAENNGGSVFALIAGGSDQKVSFNNPLGNTNFAAQSAFIIKPDKTDGDSSSFNDAKSITELLMKYKETDTRFDVFDSEDLMPYFALALHIQQLDETKEYSLFSNYGINDLMIYLKQIRNSMLRNSIPFWLTGDSPEKVLDQFYGYYYIYRTTYMSPSDLPLPVNKGGVEDENEMSIMIDNYYTALADNDLLNLDEFSLWFVYNHFAKTKDINDFESMDKAIKKFKAEAERLGVDIDDFLYDLAMAGDQDSAPNMNLGA